MKKEIPEPIRENINKANLKEKYPEVLKYYYTMIVYLEQKGRERFSLLPQLKLGIDNVKLDSRFISTIYDKFNKGNRIGIKKFEKNYKEYYKQCFNFENIGLRNWNPISIIINGYSVCV